MPRKFITIISVILIIYGIVTGLVGNILIGAILLIMNLRKSNLKIVLYIFGLGYLAIEAISFVVDPTRFKLTIPYFVVDVIFAITLLGINFYVNSKNKKVELKA
jgi:hypothetical protein